MSTVSAIVPQVITDTKLVSSNAPEGDYPVWSALRAYEVGDRCISTVTHRIYECLRANNLNKDPADIRNRAETAPWWLDFDPTNRWAMFDGDVSTQTVAPSPLTVVLKPGLFNSLYLAGVDADVANIVVKDAPGGSVVYSRTVALEGSAPADYDEYFWMPFKPRTDLLIDDIDPYGTAQVTITLSKGAGDVRCGLLAVGDMRHAGKTLYGVKVKPRSFSYIDVDKFGRTKIVHRQATTDLSLTALVRPEDADAVVELAQELLDVPAIWIGSNLPGYRSLRVFGLGSGTMEYPSYGHCRFSLDVMGVISTSSQ